ncbi:Detected protein of unknown function [Hibiscus syriacus]|uniref:Uncharacterized protein n=1 Tax=Hibiscus syriacus TaxID=106335 RepID=A0A6A3B4I6_HIBSY|nr:Detected protein of unknown function [Hibiscus syriacus]
MQDHSRPVTGYPVQNVNGCAPPPPPSRRVNGTWNVRFQVSNPNKKLSIYYGDIVSSVFHKDDFLTETRIEPFVQGTREVNSGGELLRGGFFRGRQGCRRDEWREDTCRDQVQYQGGRRRCVSIRWVERTA